MAYLEYIDDETFRLSVKNVLEAGKNKKLDIIAKDFNKNVIDPFTTLFDAAISEIDHKTWKEFEVVRQYQKALANHVGHFHQYILGHVENWSDLEVGNGVDLVCKDRKIIAEIKNKYNTVNAGSAYNLYYTLENLVDINASKYNDFTAYFVNVIPQNPPRFDKLFTPSAPGKSKRCPENKNIRTIDGASFYSLVTGRENALEELFDSLSVVIEDIFQKDYGKSSFIISDKELFKQYFVEAYIGKIHE